MPVTPDPCSLGAAAHVLAEQALALRNAAWYALDQARTGSWTSPAARQYREHLDESARRILAGAASLDRTAQTMRELAAAAARRALGAGR